MTNEIPRNTDAEETILGTILIDGQSIRDVRDSLQVSDFHSEKCGLIYQAILNISKRLSIINHVTVAQELKQSGTLNKVGGAGYLLHLVACGGFYGDLVEYSDMVIRLSISRRLVAAGDAVKGIGYAAGNDVAEDLEKSASIIEDVRQGANVLSSQSISPWGAAEQLGEYLVELESDKVSASWGFRDWDRITTGIYPGEFNIIAARPGVGKTQVMLEVANSLSCQGKKILFVSLEMRLKTLLEREIAMKLGLSIRDLRSGNMSSDQKVQIADLMGEISEKGIYYLTGDRTTAEVVAEIRRLKESAGVEYVMLDYIQRLKDCRAGDGKVNVHHKVSNASKMMAGIGKDLNISVTISSQLNRGSEYRDDKRPRLSDMRESGSLEEDGDNIFTLYREELDNYSPENKGVLEVKMAKNKQLEPAPAIYLQWIPNQHRYGDKA